MSVNILYTGSITHYVMVSDLVSEFDSHEVLHISGYVSN